MRIVYTAHVIVHEVGESFHGTISLSMDDQKLTLHFLILRPYCTTDCEVKFYTIKKEMISPFMEIIGRSWQIHHPSIQLARPNFEVVYMCHEYAMYLTATALEILLPIAYGSANLSNSDTVERSGIWGYTDSPITQNLTTGIMSAFRLKLT